MKKELTIAILMVGLTVGLSSTATADEEETSVDVEISGVTQLDVRPSSLEYTGANDNDALSPGDTRVVSDEGYEHIEVENIGSERIGSIYAQGTMHTEQPFGTDADEDTPSLHNTGNFVTISTETASSYDIGGLNDVATMHYLNRVEYFEENAPTYLSTLGTDDDFDSQDPDSGRTGIDIENVRVGRLRVGGAEYFFVIYEPDSDSGEIRIGDTPHTSTVLGTTDFTDEGSDYTAHDLDGQDGQGIANHFKVENQELVTFDTTESGNFDGSSLINDGNAEDETSSDPANSDTLEGAETRNYNLYVKPDEYVIRTRFNVEQQIPGGGDNGDTLDVDDTGAQQYILSASNSEDALQPGENFPVDFGVQVPLGVDQNAIDDGTVTVISETFSD